MIDLKRMLAAKPKGATTEEPAPLSTPWGEAVAEAAGVSLGLDRGSPTASAGAVSAEAAAANPAYVPRAEHPRPQFARSSWTCLNGWWTCAFATADYDPLEDASSICASALPPEEIATPILVPFSPEAPLSGVGRILQPNELLWYRREVPAPSLAEGERAILHFEAVDDSCAVFVNGRLVGTHNGGYLPFDLDITEALHETLGDFFRLELCVVDPSEQGIQLRGKQKLAHGDIWYSAQSGIWKPVWLELVPETYIERVVMRVEFEETAPSQKNGVLTLDFETVGDGLLSVRLLDPQLKGEGFPVANASRKTRDSRARIVLSIDSPHLWSPDDPFLYDLEFRFESAEVVASRGGSNIDPDDPTCSGGKSGGLVRSYCAFRSVEVRQDAAGEARLFLNDEPFFVKGILDQGYWPESLMTAPADEAFVFDIEAARAAGFNTLRKHIKIEDERFYYHCDRLGMLVLQDMVSGGGVYDQTLTMYIPSLFKTSWWHYSDKSPRHRAKLAAGNARYRGLWMRTCEGAVRLLRNHPSIVTWVLFNEGWGQFDSARACELVHALDATRPIEAVSGWFDQGAGDFFGVHNYFRELEVFRDPKLPRGRRALVTDEFGGLVCNVAGHAQQKRSYGYDVYESSADFREAFRRMMATMDALEERGLAGYVYTQLSDVEEETNGILTYDRKVDKLHEA